MISLNFTPRELEIVNLVRRGMTNLQIAGQLGIAKNTVKKHLTHVFEAVDNRSELAELADSGLVKL